MKKTLIALTILASTVVGARASVILADDFNSYTNGPIVPQSAWINNSGTAGTMQVTNGPVDRVLELNSLSARSEDIAQPLPGGPYMTNGPVSALYSRFTVRFTNAPSTSAGAYFAHFTGDVLSFNYHGRIWATLTNANLGFVTNSGYFYLGIGNSSGAMGVPNSGAGQWPDTFTTNVTYTIVTRFVLTNGLATMWVNPNAETDPGVTGTDANDITNFNNITWYGFRQATGYGWLYVDNFKVGTAFGDVAGPNQSPSVSSITPQFIPMNGNTGPLNFTVSDPETVASALTVSASSGNTTLVPNGIGHLDLNGDVGGTNRTLTVTPATGQQGSAIITVNANDGTNTSFTTFKVTVGAPTISAIPNQIIVSNTSTPAINFTVNDAEGDTITLSATSSYTNTVKASGIVLGGSGANRTVTVTPVPGQTGWATITIGASDGHTTNFTSFVVTVRPLYGLLYSEDFAYTVFDTPNSLYLATGGSGGPWKSVSGPSYDIQTTNMGSSGFAYIVGTNNGDLGAAFIGGATYSGSTGLVAYTSFTVNFSYLPSVGGDYFFHLAASATDSSSFHDKVFANRAGAATGKFRMAIANQASSAVGQFSRDLMPGATYAVVTRYNSATGDSVLWINPTSEQNPGAAAGDSPGSTTIGGVGLRQTGCCTGDLAIGPIKVGTSFSDVWTAPAQPQLHWYVDGSGNLVLSWDNPLFVLQSAADAAGPYTDLAATSPYTNSISGQQYFRLKY